MLMLLAMAETWPQVISEAIGMAALVAIVYIIFKN